MKQAWLVGSLVSFTLLGAGIARAEDQTPRAAEEATAGATVSASGSATATTSTGSTTASSDDDVATTGDSTTPSATVVAVKAKGPKMFGLTFGADVSDESSINAEPENYNNVASLGLNVGWKVGKVVFKTGFWSKLSASASTSFQSELTGNSDLFRGAGGSNEYIKDLPEQYVLTEQGGVLIDPNGVPRRVSGNDKRINYSDISLGLAHSSLAKLPWKMNLSGSTRFAIPISLSSRNASLYTAWSTGLSLSRSFLKDDKLSVSYAPRFTKYFHQYTTPGIHYSGTDAEIYGQVISPAEFIEHGGFRNAEFGFNNALNVGYQFTSKLSGSVSYSLSTTFTYAIQDCTIVLWDGTEYDTCASTGRVGDADGGRGRRDSQVFSLGADYSLNNWITLSGSLTTASPVRTADGHGIRQPFFSTTRNGFTSVGISASFALSELL